MKRLFVTFVVLLSTAMAWAQSPAAYVLYDEEGKSADYAETIQYLSKMDVDFMCKIHKCPIPHWMEMQVIKDFHAAWRPTDVGRCGV